MTKLVEKFDEYKINNPQRLPKDFGEISPNLVTLVVTNTRWTLT